MLYYEKVNSTLKVVYSNFYPIFKFLELVEKYMKIVLFPEEYFTQTAPRVLNSGVTSQQTAFDAPFCHA